MKPKTMVLLVLAVSCGLGASYMTSRLLAERTQEAPETVRVLVARKEMATGTSILNPAEVFAPKEFVRGAEPKDAIETYDQLKGRVLKQRLREGDHVRAEDLMSDKDALMQHLLQKGYRAIGLRVSIESIAGGFAALPLSRVDIISTVRKGDEGKSHSTTLLQNVLVLAADQQTVAEGKGALPATTVTVALKPEDVQKVNLAKEMGPLSLALRAFGDDKFVALDRTTGDGLFGGPPSEPEGPTLPVKPEVPSEVKPEPVAPPLPEEKQSIAVVSSANPSVYGQAVTFTATISDLPDKVPTGTVTFKDGDTVLGKAKVEVLGGKYKAMFTTGKVPLEVGPRAITAVLDSDDSRLASSVMTQDVKFVTLVTNGNNSRRVEFTFDQNKQVISYRELNLDGTVAPRVETPPEPPSARPSPRRSPNGVPPEEEAVPVPSPSY